jgi:hypothetical protein
VNQYVTIDSPEETKIFSFHLSDADYCAGSSEKTESIRFILYFHNDVSYSMLFWKQNQPTCNFLRLNNAHAATRTYHPSMAPHVASSNAAIHMLLGFVSFYDFFLENRTVFRPPLHKLYVQPPTYYNELASHAENGNIPNKGPHNYEFSS